jgi:hypothetical protein
MARGKDGKARRKEQRKEAQKTVADMIDGSHDMDPESDDDDDFPVPPVRAPPKVETVDEDDDDDEVVLPTPSKKSKSKLTKAAKSDSTKYTNRAAKAAGATSGPSRGIKTTPLILLVLMVGTTLIPALIYASDFLGSFLAKNNVMGAIGYRLGIGQTPKKRVLSFYEKHDPAKIADVPKILSKYYGDYPKLIKTLERKYQDYGYFLEWERDEAPMTIALEQLYETRDYLHTQFNTYAPQPVKTAVRNIQYNVGTLYKTFRKAWKKQIWPHLEPFLGVPKGTAAQKRKDAQELKKRKAAASGRASKRKNTEFRDDIEEEM